MQQHQLQQSMRNGSAPNAGQQGCLATALKSRRPWFQQRQQRVVCRRRRAPTLTGAAKLLQPHISQVVRQPERPAAVDRYQLARQWGTDGEVSYCSFTPAAAAGGGVAQGCKHTWRRS